MEYRWLQRQRAENKRSIRVPASTQPQQPTKTTRATDLQLCISKLTLLGFRVDCMLFLCFELCIPVLTTGFYCATGRLAFLLHAALCESPPLASQMRRLVLLLTLMETLTCRTDNTRYLVVSLLDFF